MFSIKDLVLPLQRGCVFSPSCPPWPPTRLGSALVAIISGGPQPLVLFPGADPVLGTFIPSSGQLLRGPGPEGPPRSS